MVILKITAEGEIWYKQERVGYKNRHFKILKFATMLKDSPNIGNKNLTTVNDPRVTGPGKFLRKTKINELPQVINVIKGEMSIVGPRPQMQVAFDVYPEHIKAKIYDMQPGITSLASIIFRDEEQIMAATGRPIKEVYADTIAPHKGKVELWYQNRASLLGDIKIIYLTAWVILFPDSKLMYKWFKDIPRLNMEMA